MSIFTILLIAIGLSMDCFAVTIAIGFTYDNFQRKQALRIAAIFGLFHILMPTLGWLIGTPFKQFISDIDHWIACIMLSGIGIKMIVEAIRNHPEEKKDINKIMVLIWLAFATSMDALIIGVSMAFLDVNIFIIPFIFGLITFLISFIGCSIGKRFGYILGERAEIIGGLVLIALGVKILLDHTLL